MMTRMLGTLAIAAATWMAATPATAADNIMKVCGAQYQAAKTGKTLPAGQTWNQYLAQCRASQSKTATPAPATKPMAATAPTAPAARTPAARPAVAAASTKSGKPESAAMTAVHDRQRQCGAQWKADKAAGKIPAGQTWPKYWSACNTRMKG
jgi:hypothetical protein